MPPPLTPADRIDHAVARFNEGELNEAYVLLQDEADAAESDGDAESLRLIIATLRDMIQHLSSHDLRSYTLLLDGAEVRLENVEHPLPPRVSEAWEAFGCGDTSRALELLEIELRLSDDEDSLEAVVSAATEMRDASSSFDRRPFTRFLERIGGGRSAPSHSGRTTSAWCSECQAQRMGQRQPASHGIHLALSILTGGIWLPVWYVVANKASAQTFFCTTCGTPIAQNLGR